MSVIVRLVQSPVVLFDVKVIVSFPYRHEMLPRPTRLDERRSHSAAEAIRHLLTTRRGSIELLVMRGSINLY